MQVQQKPLRKDSRNVFLLAVSINSANGNRNEGSKMPRERGEDGQCKIDRAIRSYTKGYTMELEL
jgi:hypothetical protein